MPVLLEERYGTGQRLTVEESTYLAISSAHMFGQCNSIVDHILCKSTSHETSCD